MVLVHGEATEMGRLKKALEQRAAALDIARTVYTPKVTQPVLIAHAPRRSAAIVGSLVHQANNAKIQGVAVKRGASVAIMNQEDLPRYTKLHAGSVTQRQALSLAGRSFSDVRLALELTFDDVAAVEVIHDEDGNTPQEDKMNGAEKDSEITLKIGDEVTVTHTSSGDRVLLEWIGGGKADMIADAVIAMILQSADEPAGICEVEESMLNLIKSGDRRGAMLAEMKLISQLLDVQFGSSTVDEKQGIIFVDVDGKHVFLTTDMDSGDVTVRCADTALKARVEKAVSRMKAALLPTRIIDPEL